LHSNLQREVIAIEYDALYLLSFCLNYFTTIENGAELSIAYLSFAARKIKDPAALKIIVISFIVFHAATGILEIYTWYLGAGMRIFGNILLRIVVLVLFYYHGIVKLRR
jgi:hypothetical protein